MRFMLSATGIAAALLTGTVALAGAAHEVRGEITSFDGTAHTLIVKETAAPRTELRLTLTDGTKIVASGKPGTLANLAPGERVKVNYTDQAAMREVTSVEILPSKAASRS